MSSENGQITINGGSQDRGTRNKVGWAAAHADDYALQEFVKLQGLGAISDRAVFPYGARGVNLGGIVQVGGGGAGAPITVYPFRAMLGPRILPSGTPPSPGSPADPIIATAPELAYRDVRSAVFAVANGGGIPTEGYQIPAAAFVTNTYGRARWDLVYAAVYIDQPSTPAEIIVKPPAGGTPGPVSASASYLTSVGNPSQAITGPTPAILVATGVNHIPALVPALPADNPAAGIYYFALAAVLVPYPWTSGTSTFVANQIAINCSPATLAEVSGGTNSGPLQANLALAGSTQLAGAWATAGQRVGYALPSSMVGRVKKTFLLDATLAAGSAPIGNAVIVDGPSLGGMDWRNRYFKTKAFAYGQSFLFASDPASQGLTPGSTGFVPGSQNQITTTDAYIWQPLNVFATGGTPPTSNAGGAGYFNAAAGASAGTNTYVIPLTNLPQGQKLKGVTAFVTTGLSNAGTATLSVVKVAFAPGTRTQAAIAGGTTTTVTSGTLTSAQVNSPSGLNATEVIDNTTYAYYALVTEDSTSAIIWSQVAAYVETKTTFPADATSWGQSFVEDSDFVVGSELGTGTGAGVVCLLDPTGSSGSIPPSPGTSGYLPQMGAGSRVGLYVDLSTGNLMTYYSGTPGVRMVFDIEATGAMDNV